MRGEGEAREPGWCWSSISEKMDAHDKNTWIKGHTNFFQTTQSFFSVGTQIMCHHVSMINSN